MKVHSNFRSCFADLHTSTYSDCSYDVCLHSPNTYLQLASIVASAKPDTLKDSQRSCDQQKCGQPVPRIVHISLRGVTIIQSLSHLIPPPEPSRQTGSLRPPLPLYY